MKLQQNDDEEEEQVGRGVSQDVVHSLLKNISIRTLFRNQERNQQNYCEKEEQVCRGFSREIVFVFFKYVSIKTPRKIKCIINLQEEKVFRDNFELTSNCSNVVPLGWGPKQGNSTKLNFLGDELIILCYRGHINVKEF